MFTLQTSFKPISLNGEGGGGLNPFVEGTVKSKEENSEDFFVYFLEGARACWALATPLIMSPILYFWEMSGFEPRELP